MSEELPPTNQFSIQLALGFAVVQMLYQVVAFVLGPSYIISVPHIAILTLLYFSLPLLLARLLQQKLSTSSFRVLFYSAFRIVAAALLLSLFFETAVINVLNPKLPYAIIETAQYKGEQMMLSLGAPEKDIANFVSQLELAKEQIEDRYSFIGLFSNYVTTLGMWILPVALAALIFKVRTPQPVNKEQND